MSDTAPIDPEAIARLLDLTLVPRLSRDIREAAKLLSAEETRFLVDTYYRLQKKPHPHRPPDAHASARW
jgi:hypothetical protein